MKIAGYSRGSQIFGINEREVYSNCNMQITSWEVLREANSNCIKATKVSTEHNSKTSMLDKVK